jgi:hypothetical protein
MKKLLIFVVILIGCSEEHEAVKKICSPFRMTISDAIPVQFWINGVETYNQKEVCGITQACFCQPFNCDDEIRIQFQDDNFLGLYYYLRILDSASTEIQSLSFSEIATGVYQLSFVPSELGICDEQIRLAIEKVLAYSDDVSRPTFINGDWSNVGSGQTWLFDFYAGIDLLTLSKRLRHSFTATEGQELTITVTGQVQLAGATYLKAFFGSQVVNFGAIAMGNYSFTQSVILEDDISYIEFEAAAGGAPTFLIESVEISGDFSNSDCLDIRTSHDCTALIRYDNSKDFADIEYSDFSPTAEFYLRIPAVFFHETNPSEQENFETSGQTIVRLRNEIKIKKLLEVGFMPDYMHRKLMLILAHDTVEIDGETWVQQDPYEKPDPSNKRYPLKKATVLLTQQGYIKRNIL